METEQEKIKRLIREADITVTDWTFDIFESITDKYAKGYLTCRMELVGNGLSSHEEDFRYEFLRFCDYDIWNK